MKYDRKRRVVDLKLTDDGALMLTLFALSAMLFQDPPASPTPPEIRGRFVILGGGLGGPGKLDSGGDGDVTREEFAAPLNGAFGRLDKNGDGRLSTEELADGGSAGAEGDRLTFRHPHPDGEDGPRIERDGDRTVVFVGGDRAAGGEHEIRVRTVGGGQPHVFRLERDSDGPGERRVEVRRFGGPGESQDLDLDGDGKVSEAEFTAPLRDAFARADADRSGFIEADERGGEGQVRVFTHRLERREGGE